jgi:hypothetical protein
MPKLAKHCNITKYLENSTKENALFAELLDDLCLRGYLRPHRLYKGMTLIIPDTKTIAQIKKLTYGSGNDWDEAQKICKSYFLNDYYGSTKDFDRKKDDIPCALGKKAFEVIKGDAKTITVKRHDKDAKEVVLEFDDGFVPPRPGYIRVMKIKKGAFVGICTGPVAENKYNLRDAPEVKGGAVRSVVFDQQGVNQGLWLCHLIGEYVANVSHTRPGDQYHNPFAHAVSSILCFLTGGNLESPLIRLVRPAPFSTLLAVCCLMDKKQFEEWYYSPFKQCPNGWSYAELIVKSVSLNNSNSNIEIRSPDPSFQEPVVTKINHEKVDAKLLHNLDCISHFEYNELLPCEARMQSADSKTHCNALVNCLSIISNMMGNGVPALKDCDTDLKNTFMDTCESGWYCFGCTGDLDANKLSTHASKHYKVKEECDDEGLSKMIRAMYNGLSDGAKASLLATLNSSSSSSTKLTAENEMKVEGAGAEDVEGGSSDIMDWLDSD